MVDGDINLSNYLKIVVIKTKHVNVTYSIQSYQLRLLHYQKK